MKQTSRAPVRASQTSRREAALLAERTAGRGLRARECSLSIDRKNCCQSFGFFCLNHPVAESVDIPCTKTDLSVGLPKPSLLGLSKVCAYQLAVTWASARTFGIY